MSSLQLYNTETRKKETFTPIHAPFVGMYVCGPTVYSNAHLGNCRTYVSFDVLYRYLMHLGYKVRYVRNITDAGHLESDADEGEDKISKKAKLEQLEPMEIVQRYTLDFRKVMEEMNTLPPSIEPTATGHIIEQIEMTKQIIANGYAYEVNGSIYFDVSKYAQEHSYTYLSGRNLEDLLNNTRDLDGQDEKRGRLDFALWIKAKPEHLMQWPSPWGNGFPGWHLECSAMSSKYLGESFDIHGGGMDLIPTHHTNEVAQNVACFHKKPAAFWLHTNMLTVNGQKMSKSLGNSILPNELFTGNHPLLTKGFSPMSVRFFMLQAHYRSTLDISVDALSAAEKGYTRLLEAVSILDTLPSSDKTSFDIETIKNNLLDALNDDLNTPVAIAHLFDVVRIINLINTAKETINPEDLIRFSAFIKTIVFEILGLKEEKASDQTYVSRLMEMIIKMRADAKSNKDWTTSDFIRDNLTHIGIQVKDGKENSTWTYIK